MSEATSETGADSYSFIKADYNQLQLKIAKGAVEFDSGF